MVRRKKGGNKQGRAQSLPSRRLITLRSRGRGRDDVPQDE